MKGKRLQDLSREEQDWIDAWIDGTIAPGDFELLQDRMMESAELRSVMRRYLAIDNSLWSADVDAALAAGDSATGPWLVHDESTVREKSKVAGVVPIPGGASVAIAAGLVLLLGLGSYFLADRTGSGNGEVVHGTTEEPSARGFAVVSRLFDAAWREGETGHREGDTLGAETFRLEGGTAEIQFFSGAVMTVEGPAEISLTSAWEASCQEGAVRMKVPPAARGFRLRAPDAEIVDLGTEFGLVVRQGKGHVEVLDGEISLRSGEEKEAILEKGQARGFAPGEASVRKETGLVAFPDADRFGSREIEEKRADFARWQDHRDALAKDSRLIAYYAFDREGGRGPFGQNPFGRNLVPNLSVPRNGELDGAVILAASVDGRWPGMKEALEFRRPGARVRVNLPGEFPSFSFVAWVRIDSLDRWYNALFMADSYETGEPHWQIRDDGKMMVSVMVDDSRVNPKNPDGPPIRFQRLYYSPPMWEPSMSGQWLHLASVFDPGNARVSHYVNGQRVSRESIKPEYLISSLRIGNAEIGNWGQPFREDPVFAIRNLNGRMDEIAIFKTALQDEEVAELYERSRINR
jgi:hypothetical protein